MNLHLNLVRGPFGWHLNQKWVMHVFAPLWVMHKMHPFKPLEFLKDGLSLQRCMNCSWRAIFPPLGDAKLHPYGMAM